MANNKIIPETIAPRSGEELPIDKLEAYLKGKLPGSDAPLTVKQFAGGHANLTYLLTYGEQHYVLRRPPLGPVPPLAHDMAREFKVLSGLNKGFEPAPRALLFCDDHDIIGADFFVMERRSGTVVRKTIPPEYGSGEDPKQNRILSETMIRTLAQFHKVDYEKVGLDGLGKAQNFMKRQTRGWAQAYHRSKSKEIAEAPDLIQWLKNNIPEEWRGSLIHNDWRLDNMMLDPEDASKVVAVFDWDMCTIGEPLADLGTLFSLWFEAEEDYGDISLPDIMPSRIPGFLTRKESAELYGQETGFNMADIGYFYVFGMFKMAIIAQQIYIRYEKGQTQDERFADFDKAAEFLIKRAFDFAQSKRGI